jgi:hypothetical protein
MERSGVIPLWKLKRELKRPMDQLRSVVLYPIDLVTKWHHDRNFHSTINLTKGDQPAGQKFALLLIYQPKKLTRSTLLTCQHLVDNGYSVLVVSNTALPDDARAQLAPVTWQILERPNIGYDFGGYRDGLRVLREANVDMQALVVLNDSVWWPLCAGDTALERAETLGADVVGMILRPYGRARKRSSVRTPHLQSYFFWFGPKALASEGFKRFWVDYRLSSFKYNAIRYGELRLTHELVNAKLTVAPLFTFDDLMEKLQTQSSDYLLKILRQGTLSKSTFRHIDVAQRARRLAAAEYRDDAWRDAVFDLFKTIDSRSEFHLTLRYPTVDLLGFNLLKRSSGEPAESMHHVARRDYLAAVENGELPAPMPDVLAEIQERERLGSVAVGR